MPPLAGLDKNYIILQMQDFKSSKRPATIMHQLAKGYSDEQIELMAEYFSVQK
jgi:cytochrome c553